MINLALALDPNQELSLDDLELVLGGGANNEAFSDAAAYAAQHAAAELLDLGAAYAPFPVNYVLDKVSDAVRPSESSYQEYADKH